MLKQLATVAMWLGMCATPALAKPPLEAFGDVPTVRSVELSPDGKHAAFLNRFDGEDYLVVYNFETKTRKALGRVTDLRARDVRFAGNDYVILLASHRKRLSNFRGEWEESTAFSTNIESGKIRQLLSRTRTLFPAQTGLGRVVAYDDDGENIYMPAFIGSASSNPSYDILKVSLDTGRGQNRGGIPGQTNTIDWILDSKGNVLAREDFSEKQGLHEIRVYDGNKSRPIYSEEASLPTTGLIGVSSDHKNLMLVDTIDSEFRSLYQMSIIDGAITGPLMQREDADVAEVITDNNRVVLGVRYSGMRPTYEMFDPELTTAIANVQAMMPNASVWLDSWTNDWSKVLFFVSGGYSPERYLLFDRENNTLTNVANARSGITDADVGEVMTIEYKARDGLKIPSILTWPASIAEEDRKNLPLVVLPHGGPEAYDSVQFSWLAQFLANEGYLVLQPNFRGSAGFGAFFRYAGHGEWGRKMQDDINDGTAALIDMGWARAETSCIVGWSYGGYAALAAGGLSPDTYKCIASIAGVSDLRRMLTHERSTHGSKSRTYTYWKALIGDPDTDRDAIDAVSPYLLAANFTASVLLIHGTEDTVVPSRQSEKMEDALREAKKEVRYVKIRGDDHSLVENESRRTALTELGTFLAQHLKPDS